MLNTAECKILTTTSLSICAVLHLYGALELFPIEENPHHDEDGDDGDECDEEEDDDDSGTDHVSVGAQSCTQLQPAEPVGSGGLPAVFQTDHLVFYERFKVYQDYMLGNHQLISCF